MAGMAPAVTGKAPAEEAEQGAQWPDLVAVVPKHDDHNHDVVLVLLGREHGRLKPVDGAELDLRLLPRSSARRRHRARPPPPTPVPRHRSCCSLLPLLAATPAGWLLWRRRARERGTGEREKERERRGVEGESVAGDMVATGARRCNASLAFVPWPKSSERRVP
ncbi:Os02g0603300 [Oryza sativa Japonica Group]|uniref:Os02g0603300 protein n=1 Tax=Oryza sativa subsp. japonica TaxID=39947 RepID=A0A0P0VLN3_ORYSJ|nr:Os02g0603300 [Oryza sativa Japonica Group]